MGFREFVVLIIVCISICSSPASAQDNSDEDISSILVPIISLIMSDKEDGSDSHEDEEDDADEIFPPILDPEEFDGKFVMNLIAEDEYRDDGKKERSFTQLNSNFSVFKIDDETIAIRASGWDTTDGTQTRDEAWLLTLSAPNGSGMLTTGNYQSVSPYPYHGSNYGMRVHTDSSSCTSSGYFRIYELEFSGSDITKLVVDFSEHCFSQTPTLKGSIYYDASKPDAVMEHQEPSNEPEFLALPELQYAGAALNIDGDINHLNIRDDYMFTQSDSNFSISPIRLSTGRRGVSIEAITPDITIKFELYRGRLDIDPLKESDLGLGVYKPAFSNGTSGIAPTFRLTFGSTICTDVYSSFNVYELEYTDEGDVKSLAFDFSHRCNLGNGGTAKGSFKYDSELPAHPLIILDPPSGEPYPALPDLEYAGGVLRLEGSPGQFFLGNYSLYLDSYTANFRPNPNSSHGILWFNIFAFSHTINIGLKPSELDINQLNGEPLTVGYYPNSREASPFSINSGLSVSAFGGGCNISSGEFTIFDIAYSNEGILDKLTLDFEYYCEQDPSVLKGSLIYDATLPAHPEIDRPLPVGPPDPALPNLQYKGGVMRVIGEQNDYITNNEELEFDSTNSNFFIEPIDSNRGFRVRVYNQGTEATLDLSRAELDIDPLKDSPLTAGVYEFATRLTGPQPSLAFSYDHRSCSSVIGSFNIHQISYDMDGNIESVIADFEQQCGESSETLRGSFHYDSTLPDHPYQPIEIPTGEPYPTLPSHSVPGASAIYQHINGVVNEFASDQFDFEIEDSRGSDTGIRVTVTDISTNFPELFFWLNKGQLDIDPNREDRLSRGIYRNALGYPQPEIQAYSCLSGISSSEFRIFEIEYNNDDDIVWLKADFAYTCVGISNTIRFSISYDYRD